MEEIINIGWKIKIPGFAKAQDDPDSNIKKEEIRKAKGKDTQDLKDTIWQRSFLGKVKQGFKKTGKFAWNHKKKLLTAAGCVGAGSYLAPAGTIISLIGGTQMDFLTGLPEIISLIIAVVMTGISIYTKIKKDGLQAGLSAVGSNLDEALEAFREAKEKDSEGGKNVTKGEWTTIARLMNTNSKAAKKIVEKNVQ